MLRLNLGSGASVETDHLLQNSNKALLNKFLALITNSGSILPEDFTVEPVPGKQDRLVKLVQVKSYSGGAHAFSALLGMVTFPLLPISIPLLMSAREQQRIKDRRGLSPLNIKR